MSASLQIHVDDILPAAKRFALVTDLVWWADAREQLREPGAEVRKPVAARLEAYRLGQRLLFRGAITGTFALPCARCLDAYDLVIAEPIELLLEPAPRGADLGRAGIELDAEDGGLGRYAGDELDFGPVILEILALAWPMQPRCSENCLGLCPVCGGNRNHDACACEPVGKNRPFADLAERLKEARGSSDDGSE